jgi:hypothetical protein
VRSLYCDRTATAGYEARVTTGTIQLVAGDGTAFTVLTGPTVPANAKTLLTFFDDGVNLSVQVDSGGISTVARPAVVGGAASFTIGKDSVAAANFFSGKLYAYVYAKNSRLTASERASAQAYVRQQAGM